MFSRGAILALGLLAGAAAGEHPPAMPADRGDRPAVQMTLPGGFAELVEPDGTFTEYEVQLQNDSTTDNLKDWRFRWRHMRLPDARSLGSGALLAEGSLAGPDVPPGGKGRLPVRFKNDLDRFNRLYVTAVDPAGREVLTVSARTGIGGIVSRFKPKAWWVAMGLADDRWPEDPVHETPRVEATDDEVVVHAREAKFTFSRHTGRLATAQVGGRDWSFFRGPTLLALKPQGREREPGGAQPKLISVTHGTHTYSGEAWVAAKYENPSLALHWGVNLEGQLDLSYHLIVTEEYDALGLRFELPDAVLRSKRWLGEGPPGVSRELAETAQYGVHEIKFTSDVAGEKGAEPAFQGYHRDWEWLTLQTTAGRLVVEPSPFAEAPPFFGLGQPRAGARNTSDMSDTGLSFLNLIPAMPDGARVPESPGLSPRVPDAPKGYVGAVVFHFTPL